jgi:protein SOK2
MKAVCVFRLRQRESVWREEKVCIYILQAANGDALTESEDNHMINGTKLLNVAGMTRGRRDGILKSEKMRHVVKIGPMHLKGVW